MSDKKLGAGARLGLGLLFGIVAGLILSHLEDVEILSHSVTNALILISWLFAVLVLPFALSTWVDKVPFLGQYKKALGIKNKTEE